MTVVCKPKNTVCADVNDAITGAPVAPNVYTLGIDPGNEFVKGASR